MTNPLPPIADNTSEIRLRDGPGYYGISIWEDEIGPEDSVSNYGWIVGYNAVKEAGKDVIERSGKDIWEGKVGRNMNVGGRENPTLRELYKMGERESWVEMSGSELEVSGSDAEPRVTSICIPI